MLNYKKLINGIATSTFLLSTLFGAGCATKQEPTAKATINPTAIVEPTATIAPTSEINPTPTLEERVEESTGPKLAFVAQDEEYVEDIWITDGNEIKRMTHDLNWETDLAWSQDGKTLFYFSNHVEEDWDRNLQNHTQTYNALDVETGEIRKIHEEDFDLLTPIHVGVAFDWLVYAGLSPDTSQVVFIEREGGEKVDYHEIINISVFDTETSERIFYEELVDPEYFYNSHGGIGWLDENSLFIQIHFTESDAVYKYDLKTSEMEKIVDGVYNDLEFNQVLGKFIFTDEDENGEDYYYEMDIDGQNIKKLLIEEDVVWDYAWLSDGNFMYVTTLNESPGQIRIANPYIDGELFFSQGDFFRIHNINPSSNGLNVVFKGRKDKNSEESVYVIDVRRRSQEEVFTPEEDNNYIWKLEDFGSGYPFFHVSGLEVAWSPHDGDFAFSDDVKIVDEFEEDLLTINSIDEKVVLSLYDRIMQADIWTLEGDNLVRLTNDEYDESDVIVSPDGNRIFFTQYNHDVDYYAGFIMDSDGSNKRQLFTFERGIYNPEWVADENILAFIGVDEDYSRNMYYYSFNSDELDLITNFRNQQNFDISQDGKKEIIIFKDSIVYLENNQIVEEIKGNFSGNELVQYSPTGEQILISSEDPFNNRLYVGEDILNLRVLSEDFHIGASWSPDGESIVYTTKDEETCKLIISNNDGSEKEVVLERPEKNTPYPSQGNCYSSPIFSPSGDTIIYTLELGFNGAMPGIGRLYAINVDGTNNRKLPMDFVEGQSIRTMNLDPFDLYGKNYDFFPGR